MQFQDSFAALILCFVCSIGLILLKFFLHWKGTHRNSCLFPMEICFTSQVTNGMQSHYEFWGQMPRLWTWVQFTEYCCIIGHSQRWIKYLQVKSHQGKSIRKLPCGRPCAREQRIPRMSQKDNLRALQRPRVQTWFEFIGLERYKAIEQNTCCPAFMLKVSPF